MKFRVETDNHDEAAMYLAAPFLQERLNNYELKLCDLNVKFMEEQIGKEEYMNKQDELLTDLHTFQLWEMN